MGAKRAVEGRTQPFNELLAAYQKKGIGRPQGIFVNYMIFSGKNLNYYFVVPVGAVGSKNNQTSQHGHQQSQQQKLLSTKSNVNQQQQKSLSTKSNVNQQQQQQQQQQQNAVEDDNTNITAIDSDEETENVRMAIEQNRPNPLGCRQVYYVRRKREYHKLRDILLEAITPKVNPSTSTTSTTNNSIATTTNLL
jgi:hypothetical protein